MAATQFLSVNSFKIIVVIVRAEAVSLKKEQTRLAENLLVSSVETLLLCLLNQGTPKRRVTFCQAGSYKSTLFHFISPCFGDMR